MRAQLNYPDIMLEGAVIVRYRHNEVRPEMSEVPSHKK